jgi:hypothetical protein
MLLLLVVLPCCPATHAKAGAGAGSGASSS